MMTKMKKIIKRSTPGALLMFLMILMLSCSDFLDENPQDKVAQNNYYTTSQDAIAAVNAIYAYLGAYNNDALGPFPGNTAGIYHSTFWYTIGLASDNLKNNQA